MKVLMVEHFLPGSVYTLELCRALRTEEQITIFCRKGAPRPLEGVQWKDKLYAGGKGWAEALMRYGGGCWHWPLRSAPDTMMSCTCRGSKMPGMRYLFTVS